MTAYSSSDLGLWGNITRQRLYKHTACLLHAPGRRLLRRAACPEEMPALRCSTHGHALAMTPCMWPAMIPGASATAHLQECDGDHGRHAAKLAVHISASRMHAALTLCLTSDMSMWDSLHRHAAVITAVRDRWHQLQAILGGHGSTLQAVAANVV